MSRIKGIIFDLDDTLAPELSYVKSGYGAVAEKLLEEMGADTLGRKIAELKGSAEKNPEADREKPLAEGSENTDAGYREKLLAENISHMLWQLFLQDHGNVFNRFFDLLQVVYDREMIMKYVDCYRGHYPDRNIYSLYEDAEPALGHMKKMGLRLGLLSDGFAAAQRKKYESLGLEASGYFDFVMFTGEWGEDYKKPSAKGFREAAKAFGCKPWELMYVGDNPAKDFYVKKELKLTTVRICRPEGVYLDTPYREDVMEDIRIENLMELISYLSEGREAYI